MKKHFYFYKKDDDNYNNVVMTKGIQSDPYHNIELQNLKKIDDIFYLKKESIVYLLDDNNRERFKRFNFDSGLYHVISLKENINYIGIHLKEIETYVLNFNNILIEGTKLVIDNKIHLITETIIPNPNSNNLITYKLVDNNNNETKKSQLDLIALESKIII